MLFRTGIIIQDGLGIAGAVKKFTHSVRGDTTWTNLSGYLGMRLATDDFTLGSCDEM